MAASELVCGGGWSPSGFTSVGHDPFAASGTSCRAWLTGDRLLEIWASLQRRLVTLRVHIGRA